MLATPVDQLPVGDDWRHEIKWDGMRALVSIEGSSVRVFSRTERDVTVAFPELVSPRAHLAGHEDLLLDGEIVTFVDGRPSFAQLGARFHATDESYAARLAADSPVTLIAFDVLRVLGRPVHTLAWSQRRELLEATGLGSPWVQIPPVFDDGAELLAATAEQHLEGVVSKRVGAPYRPGVRSEDWRKRVHRRTDSFVVVVGARRRTAMPSGRCCSARRHPADRSTAAASAAVSPVRPAPGCCCNFAVISGTRLRSPTTCRARTPPVAPGCGQNSWSTSSTSGFHLVGGCVSHRGGGCATISTRPT